MSTIRVNTIQSTSTTDGGISIDSSGHVTLDGQSLPSAGPLSNRNLIINGAMQVAQRGTTSTDNGFGTVDRYTCLFAGGAQTQTQETLTTGDPYDEGFRNFLRITNTTASTDAGSYRSIQQKIEAQNIAQSGWNYTSSTSYITLSFWVRASVSQEYYGHLRTEDGTDQLYGFSLGTLAADTWTKVTKTIPGNTNLQFDNNNGSGLRIRISAFMGTDFTDSGVSVDTWAAFVTASQFPDYTNTWANTADATFDITGLQLEVGSVATPFEHRSYGDELRRCQRYYQRLQNTLTGTTRVRAFLGQAISASTVRGVYDYPVMMRTAPTALEQSGDSADYLTSGASGTLGACTSVPTFLIADTYSISMDFTRTSSHSAGNVSTICFETTTDAFLGWSAEL